MTAAFHAQGQALGMGVSAQPEPEIRAELAGGALLVLVPEWPPAKVRYASEALRRSLLAR